MTQNPPETDITPELIAEHGLSQDEYDRILGHLERAPNLVELGVFSVMWSEHCSYKSSRRHLAKLPTTAPWVICGPGENAGVIDIGASDDEESFAAIFKMESHNHPSFIEPYQGAATGVGGIMRDVFTMGARPVANLNALRFGDINDKHTPHLLSGVVSGIGGYGNCMGVPTVGGETNFHRGYNQNILVNAMTVGVAPKDKIFYAAARGAGNPVVYVGSKTGRDGIHGATMASAEFDDQSSEKRPTVQVGDPFTEKLLLEACLELMASDAIIAIQDMGAAGLTSSSVEMASKGAGGFDLDLDAVPQRETNMTAYEMLLSESQERMLMVLKPGREEEARKIFEKWGIDFAVIGKTTDSGKLVISHQGAVVADLPVGPLTDDAPNYDRLYEPAPKPEPLSDPAIVIYEMMLTWHMADKKDVGHQQLVETFIEDQIRPLSGFMQAGWSGAHGRADKIDIYASYQGIEKPDFDALDKAAQNLIDAGLVEKFDREENFSSINLADHAGTQTILTALGQLMSCPDLCSRRWIWEQYDHTVMGDSVIRPGGDAALVRVHGTGRGLAVSTDVSPRYVLADPHEGGKQAVAETWRNICATGAKPLAITNCLNFGNPERPEIMAQFVGAIEGISEACKALDYPVVSGNVSLYNETNGQAIPPTPAIGGVGVIEDITKSITVGGAVAGAPVDLELERKHGELVRKLIDERLITACHDVSDGGLLVAAAEMALACGEGLELTTPVNQRVAAFWYGEDQGRYLISATPSAADTVLLKAAMAGVQATRIGRVAGRDILLNTKPKTGSTKANPVKHEQGINTPERDVFSIQALHDLWQSTLPDLMSGPSTHNEEIAPMPMAADDIKKMVLEALPDAEIEIEDLAGDGDHYRARIISKAFAGKSRVQQHQLVYGALKGKMGGELHALALETAAPDA